MVEDRRTFEPTESREAAERLFIEDFDTWAMTGYYLYSKLLRSGVSDHIDTGGGEQWVIIAPRRVVAPESEQKRAGAPLDIEVAEPLESILRTRLADSPRDRQFKEGASNVIRIKIVSVSHDVSYLGMGKAQAHIRLDFYICAKGDVPDTSTVKTVTRNGPDISTLWHQPRGSELQAGFRKATDEGLTAIVDYAFRSSK